MKDRLPEGKLSEKMNKLIALRIVKAWQKYVNQAVWDNLSPSVHVRSQGVKMQKARLHFNGICALTCMINKLAEQIAPLPVGS